MTLVLLDCEQPSTFKDAAKVNRFTILKDSEVRERDPLIFNLVSRKALVKYGVWLLFIKDLGC